MPCSWCIGGFSCGGHSDPCSSASVSSVWVLTSHTAAAQMTPCLWLHACLQVIMNLSSSYNLKTGVQSKTRSYFHNWLFLLHGLSWLHNWLHGAISTIDTLYAVSYEDEATRFVGAAEKKTWGIRHLSNQARKDGEGEGVEERQISSLFFFTIAAETSR
jgi:hypothetical protein